MSSTSSVFAPLSLNAVQEVRLENMMKQQVQDAILARRAQLSADVSDLDSNWRFVSSVGQLKTYKLRGADSYSSTPSWSSTSTRCTRATTFSMNDSVNTNSQTLSRIRTHKHSKRLSLPRRTVSVMTGRRDPLDSRPPLRSYRTFGRVQGYYRDIVDVHCTSNTTDFVQQQKLLSPEVIDGAVLHTILATRDSYLGIKWLAENTLAGKRDICFVEMVGYTTNTDGQEVGFVAMASIDVPECPEFTGSMKMTRMRMKRTLIINPSIESKGTSELFVMGATETNESSITENAQYRMNMAVLNDISLVIDSRNIAKQTLTPPRNWIPDKSCQSCSICCRNFNFMYRRRHHCRLCGDVICKTCYVTRGVLDSEADRPVDVCQRKFCVRCVMGLRVMDKRLDKFSRRFSKLLPHNKEPSNFSASTPEHQLSTGNMLGSFTTYFKRGSNQKHRINLSQLYKLSATQETSPEIDENQSGGTCARAFVGGFLVSYDCGSSKCCQSSPSLNLLHSNSYGKLRHLSRHGSTASLVSNSDSIEETLIPKMDEVTRMVII